MVLTIFAWFMTVSTTASLVNEIFSLIKILLISGHFIQLAQSHLNNRMPAWTMYLSFARSESLTNKVCILYSYVKQHPLACRLIMCHRSCIQRTAVIQFMRIDSIPSVCAPPSAKSCALVGHTSCQISIFFLSFGYDIYHAVKIMIQSRIIFQ